MTEEDYLQERDRIRRCTNKEKSRRLRNILKVSALDLGKAFTIGECMDEFACSYSSVFRAYQEIKLDPAYSLKEKKIPHLGLPKQTIARKD